MFESTLCYIHENDRYLLLHRVKKKNDVNEGKWIGVGGHVEPGETPEACVRREVMEETGLTLRHLKWNGIVDFLNDRWESEIMYLYTSDSVSGTLKECDEGDLAWIPKNEIPALPQWEGDRLFLEKIANGDPFFHMQLVYRGDRLVSHRLLPRIILASASPRRRDLMERIGLLPECRPSSLPEHPESRQPADIVKELSFQKANDIFTHLHAAQSATPAVPEKGIIVIGADTVVATDGRVLGKPRSHDEAAAMIRHIAGRTHHVFTGLTVFFPDAGHVTVAEETAVEVYPMSDAEIAAYASSDEPMDKAGAYAIQGHFSAFIKGIRGSYDNVVGLPAARLYQLIKAWL